MSSQNKSASVFIIIVAIIGLILGGMVISAPSTNNGSQQAVNEDEAIISRNNKFVIGNENAKVRVVIFSDYLCPYCADVHAQMNEIVSNDPDKVSFVTRSFIVHDEAMIMSQAAHAAGEQGKFKEASDLLFEKYNEGTEEKMLEMARELNLDENKFKNDLNSEETKNFIQTDNEDAFALNLRGTPSIFVNGKYVDDPSNLMMIIEEAAK
ncbi:MAG: DSBA-like thioredoxin domain protein [candidate division WS2 bacterium ADurb.Bin280]|uniref:DSBA-like thioredoxin domain protein n=1 Tax=candidate division WS2 bacterium ADurb.Bin280 TaxID=1852829 RepID=A0A1V5SG58_9BACT|nr:MAG: DSBA-like thioredoxin domain protein [candidate division WS2 bacterium ADurb.Bin280]